MPISAIRPIYMEKPHEISCGFFALATRHCARLPENADALVR